ncbi:hypothetical protein [Paenibacillus chitinolyticus]|uniref:hypothetical protein n=1 Tax=Paenibacillus chitinolyticus TaxID=79263 RepID=UPI003629E26A
MERKTIKHLTVYLKKSWDDSEFEEVLSKKLGTNLGHIAIWLTGNKIPTPYNIKPDGKN